MSAITIAVLVEAAMGIVKISGEVIKLVDQLPSKRRVREEDIASIKTQIDELAKAQDELKNNLGALANALDAHIRTYFSLESLPDACERLQMYIKENWDDFSKKSAAKGLWSNVEWRFEEIQKEARDKYKMGYINKSGFLGVEVLTKIELYVGEFNKAVTQAKVFVDGKKRKRLHECVETMVEKSQEISNVLQHRIHRILERPTSLQ
jgi:hypothetical protein